MNKTVKELANNKARSIFAELETVEVPSFIDKTAASQPFTNARFTSKTILINQISLYGTASCNVQYYDATNFNQVNGIIVPSEFLLKILDGETAAKLQEQYEAFVFKNLSKQIFYSGNIGSDPEIFVTDENKKLIPAFYFLGSKAAPSKHNANNCYWDGFQAEFTTVAGSCMDGHTNSLFYGLRGVYREALKYDPKAKLSIETIMDIAPDLIQNSAPEHVAFGCMPSLNAYGLEGQKADGREVFYRTAGGHIHFGPYSKKQGVPIETDVAVRIVKALDAILGVACVSMFANYDNRRRRQMYGLAGEYRLPPHGIEYRTLSNMWLCHPLIANIVFDFGRSVYAFGEKNLLKYWQHDEAETIRIINEHDVDAARLILEKNKETVLKLLGVRYKDTEQIQRVWEIILGGIETIIQDPADVVGNWRLQKTENFHYTDKGMKVFMLGTRSSPETKVQKGEKV